MRSCIILVSCGIVCLNAALARGDGLVRRLPEDGAWALFYCTEEYDDGEKRTEWITIKSVGTIVEDGQACRWIEVVLQNDEGRRKGTGSTWKFLIPEKHFVPEGDPLDHVIRTWHKYENQQSVRRDIDFFKPRLHLIIPPPIKDLKEIAEKQTVDWQRGQLVCNVLVGTIRQEYKVETVKKQYRIAVHDKVGFGVAAVKIEMESDLPYKGTVQFMLTDMGTDAKSGIPDGK